MRGEKPLAYVLFQTHLGYRAYAEKEMSGFFDPYGLLANGTVLGDGSELAGAASDSVIEKSARLKDLGDFERSLQPRSSDILMAFYGKQLSHASIGLDNTDHYFTRLMMREPFLTRPMNIYIGFDSMPMSEHISMFKGVVSEVSVTLTTMTVEADER